MWGTVSLTEVENVELRELSGEKRVDSDNVGLSGMVGEEDTDG